MNRQTTHAKNHEEDRAWRHVDANGQVVGRLATKIAMALMGKDKPTYTPNHDVGDFVVVTNAEKIVLTGRKLDQKFHDRYSGHPGGRTVVPFRIVMDKHPERILEHAVRRMLPKNKLGVAQLKKLKVYAGSEHPHQAQQPISVSPETMQPEPVEV